MPQLNGRDAVSTDLHDPVLWWHRSDRRLPELVVGALA